MKGIGSSPRIFHREGGSGVGDHEEKSPLNSDFLRGLCEVGPTVVAALTAGDSAWESADTVERTALL